MSVVRSSPLFPVSDDKNFAQSLMQMIEMVQCVFGNI